MNAKQAETLRRYRDEVDRLTADLQRQDRGFRELDRMWSERFRSARAALARVEKLADKWAQYENTAGAAAMLRAALAGSETERDA